MTLVLEFGFVQSAGLPLEGVIALVCRCLAVSTDQLLQAGQVLLASVIPRIHVVALRILESVVGAARGHTQVHAGTISTVLRQALRRSPPQGRLRAAVYDALKRVMLVLGPVIQLPDLDQIVGAALQDCSKQTVSGEGAAEGGAGAGGAAAAAAEPAQRGRGGVTILAEASEAQQPEVDSCTSALQMLAALLMVHAVELDGDLRRKIDAFLIAGALSCAEFDGGGQFTDGRCRIELYKTLKAGISAPSPSASSVLPQATRVFTWGLQDTSLAVRAVCIEALSICDQIVRPQFPSLPRRVAPPPPQPESQSQQTGGAAGFSTGGGVGAGAVVGGEPFGNNNALAYVGAAAPRSTAASSNPAAAAAAQEAAVAAAVAPVQAATVEKATASEAAAAEKESSSTNNKRGNTSGASSDNTATAASTEDRPAKMQRREADDSAAVTAAQATAPVAATAAAAAAAAAVEDDDDEMPDIVNSGPDTDDEEDD